jgi:hypothetical protein
VRKPQPGDRAWCYYRNLVHTVYREIRHAGGPSDPGAKLRVPDNEFAAAMVSVREWRDTLKGTWLFDRIRDEQTTTAIRRPYEEVTRMTIEEVRDLFGRPGWARAYGGERWRNITSLAIRLGEALDRDDTQEADQICEAVAAVEHNSGPLVPRTTGEQNVEKWPCLCDGREG